VLVYKYIDRGVGDWIEFADSLNHYYPNLKVLILSQNYSYPTTEKEFLTFIDTMNLELVVIDDNQTDWLKKYKFTNLIQNTFIFGGLND
jgi:hypothetical protein